MDITDKLYSYNPRSIVFYGILVSLAIFLSHNGVVEYQSDTLEFQRWVIAGIGFLANFGIVYHHMTVPPHPKFLLVTKRKINIRLHAFFGITEVLAGTVCLFHQSEIGGMIFGVLAILHALTALNQTPTVFGAKGIMLPSYIFAGALHLYVGYRVFNEPTSFFWIMNTYLTLNIYAYVRIIMVACEKVNIFNGYHYSLGVLLAGLFVGPALMGPATAVYFVVFIAITYIAMKLVFGFSWSQLKAFMWKEHDREKLVDPDLKDKWLRDNIGSTGELTAIDEKTARTIFDKLDDNGNGILEPEEMDVFLVTWGMTSGARESLEKYMNQDITFENFYEIVKYIGISIRSIKNLSKGEEHTDEEKAKLVFNELDMDNSGHLDCVELELLLLEYGLPKNEAITYLKKYNSDGDGEISFDEFFTDFGPLWRFAYTYS